MCSQNCNGFWVLAPSPLMGPCPRGIPWGGGAEEPYNSRSPGSGEGVGNHPGTFPQGRPSPHSPQSAQPWIEGDPKTGWDWGLDG